MKKLKFGYVLGAHVCFYLKKKKKIIVVAIVNIDDVLKLCQMSYSVPDINNDLFQLDYRFLYLWISFLISSSGLNRFINCLCFIFFCFFFFCYPSFLFSSGDAAASAPIAAPKK